MKKYLHLSLALGFIALASHSYAQKAHARQIKAGNVHKAGNIQTQTAISTLLLQPKSLLQIYDSVYSWDFDTLNKKWDVNGKYVDITYDAKNNLTGAIGKVWENNLWVNSDHFTSIYDANNNETAYTQFEWDGAAWIYSTQNNYSYDANHNQLSDIGQTWDGSAWVDQNRYLNTYDVKNNKTVEIYQKTSGSGWENSTKNSYTYDANNNLVHQIHQYWNKDSLSWINTNQYIYSYDNNNITGEDNQSWYNSTWINTSKTTYTYVNNNLVNRFYQYYQGVTTLINSSQQIYSYDLNNNMTKDLHQFWKNNQWINSAEERYTYGPDNFEKSNVYVSYDQTGNNIKTGDSTAFYYHAVPNGIPFNKNNNQLKIYPNPSSGLFIVELEQGFINAIEVYNLTGQRILQQRSGPVDLSGYPKGIYLLRVENQGQSHTHTRNIVIN